MIIKGQNFSHARLLEFDPQPGDIIESCNLAQMHPHTPIAVGVADLQYKDCNLVNCDVSGVVEHCNIMQISRCGNLQEGFSCVVDCEHVTISEDIIVDGLVVDTLRQYADKVVV